MVPAYEELQKPDPNPRRTRATLRSSGPKRRDTDATPSRKATTRSGAFAKLIEDSA
jgi:hypothetical protein